MSRVPRNHIWNTRIDRLPVHEMSGTWLDAMNASSRNLHPDFGPPAYGLPFETVARMHPKVAIEFLYEDESNRGPYPFDARTPVEGGSDRHALMVERGTCRLYELFAAEWNDGDPSAGSGAIWDLDRNRLRPRRLDLGGRGRVAHLRRLGPLGRGEVGPDRPRPPVHGLLHHRRVRLAGPPRGRRGRLGLPAGGARFRLRSDVDLSGFSPKARVILRAMKRFGMMVADKGSDWYLQGTRGRHWRNRLLDQLKSVPADVFEAVDVSACMLSPSSGRSDCPA